MKFVVKWPWCSLPHNINVMPGRFALYNPNSPFNHYPKSVVTKQQMAQPAHLLPKFECKCYYF